MKTKWLMALLLLVVLAAPTITAEDASSDAGQRPGYLGLVFTYHAPSERSAGFMTVRNLVPGGPAERAGLKPGDLIVEIKGRQFSFVSDYEMLVHWAQFAPGKPIKLTILRDRKRETVEMVTSALTDAMYEVWKVNLALARDEHERRRAQ